MSELTHRYVMANGIRIHVVENGRGPAVLLCHGFPECWYSWRHQISALAEAGFRAIAIDLRGYGESEVPEDVAEYTMLHLVGDVVGVLDALGIDKAAIIGHDWGAPVAWHAALLRRDRFTAVVGLSVPFIPRAQVYPSRTLPETADEVFYQQYFQRRGIAEAYMQRDVQAYLRGLLYSSSGDGVSALRTGRISRQPGMVPRDGPKAFAAPPILPSWLNEDDVDFYAAAFSRTGFSGGLNWYRNVERNWTLLAAFDGMKIEIPALYIVGEHDIVFHFEGMKHLIAEQPQRIPRLHPPVILPGCGHWTQQERPREVNYGILVLLCQ